MNITVENKLAQTSGKKIERLHKPTPEEFKRATHSYSQPVIITGKIAEWKAFFLWSIDYLNTVVGDKEIIASVSQNKVFGYDQGESSYPNIKMLFREFTDWIVQGKKGDQSYYLQQHTIDIFFPELYPDIETPDYIPKKLLAQSNLWIGTGDNITPLHWDAAQNLLCQVRGRKRVLLFEPKQTPFLYPASVHSKTPHISHLNSIDKPDFEKFPKFQKAKYTECLLEQGEMLFIPTYWWHQVYSLDQLNIAANFWWYGNFQHYLAPQGRRFLLQRPIMFWYLFKELARALWRNKIS
ncbi:cupin-like domain-containing protein [Nostoc sp. UHCC 0702]|nr:cupin-like domain-containing protein [Nostoc sp. UHCC 0702]